MTSEHIQLVRETWADVVPIAAQAADTFYDRLFEQHPALADLFPREMGAQKAKLLATLDTAVGALADPEGLALVLREMGRRHAGYGATTEGYEAVGAALLWTLEKGLGARWTEEAHEAWSSAYGFISSEMIAGSQTERRVA